MRRITRTCLTILRHLLALGSTAGLTTVLAAAFYVELLGMAIVMNKGLGSPVMPIIMPLFGLACGLVYGALICLPVSTLVESLLRRRQPHVLEFVLPLVGLAAVLVAGVLVSLVAGAALATDGSGSASMPASITSVWQWAMVLLFASVPVLAPPLTYWTVLRGSAWLLSVIAQRFRRIAPYVARPELLERPPAAADV